MKGSQCTIALPVTASYFTLLLALGMWLSFAANHAEAQLYIRKPTADWGKVEAGKPAQHTYTWQNNGLFPVALTRVVPGCGVTVSDYTRGSVLPGFFGEVTLSVNTRDRLGPFASTATLYSTANSLGVDLSLQMNITPPPPGSVLYRDTLGTLAVEGKHESVGVLYSNRPTDIPFRCRNLTDHTLHIAASTDTSAAFVVSFKNDSLAAGSAGILLVHYLPGHLLGTPAHLLEAPFRAKVDFKLQGEATLRSLYLTGTFVRVYAVEEIKAAPHIKVTNSEQLLHYTGTNVPLLYQFVLRNTGGSTLKIQKIWGESSFIKTSLPTFDIAPGEEVKLAVYFNVAGLSGPVHRTLTLLTNDPLVPRQMLHLRVE